jgi:hypothetical protein
VPAEVTGSLGSPGRSALVEYRRRRALELAAWTRTLTWRAPLIAAAGLAGQVLAIQTELLHGGLVGLAVAILVGWRQRFRLSEQVTAWRRGAKGERRTARLLDRLTRDGFVVFHDLAIPGSPANVDHLMIGSTGVFVIDSKQWTGTVHQSADGLAWHNHHRLDRTLETVRWEAQAISRLLGTRAAALLCVHGAHVHGGGLHAHGVAIVPAGVARRPRPGPGAVGRRYPAVGCRCPPAAAAGRLTFAGSPFAPPWSARRPGSASTSLSRSRLHRHVGGLVAGSSR